MSLADDYEEQSKQSFWRRNGLALGLGTLAITVVIAFAFKMSSGDKTPLRRAPELTMVRLLPPPPPPPPPPQQPPPPEQKIEEEQKIDPEPEAIKEDIPEPPDENLGSNIKGDGAADGFGLSGSGNGNRVGGGNGARWGAYAGQVRTKIDEAMRNNSRTLNAGLSVRVNIWPDGSGRIVRAQMASSTGDAALDSAIQNEILTGLQLPEPPPEDMPKPIKLRLTARRPN